MLLLEKFLRASTAALTYNLYGGVNASTHTVIRKSSLVGKPCNYYKSTNYLPTLPVAFKVDLSIVVSEFIDNMMIMIK